MRTPVSLPPASSRRARERAAREGAVLDAAERAIARRGFHGAGMVEIAREAGFALGTVYSLFGSKEEIYRRLLETRARELTADLRAGLAGSPPPGSGEGRTGEARPRVGGAASPRDRLEAALAAKVRFFERHEDFIRLYAPASPADPAALSLPPSVVRLREGNRRAIARVLARARRARQLATDVAPGDAALAFQVVSTAFLLAAAREGGRRRFERVARAMRGVFFDPLFGRRRAKGGRR